MYAAAGGLSLARRQARRQQRQQAAESRSTFKPPSTPLPPIRHQFHSHQQHQQQPPPPPPPQQHHQDEELLQMSKDVQSQLLEPPNLSELNGRITSFGSSELSPEGKAAWQERERERRVSLTEVAVNHRIKATEAHRRWMKRNRIHDSSFGGSSSDDEDIPGGLYGHQSAAANALLYVGLGTVAIGLVISFVGTGEKGFKTLELRLIGPTLIGSGLLCCLVRIFLCVCPSRCFRRRHKHHHHHHHHHHHRHHHDNSIKCQPAGNFFEAVNKDSKPSEDIALADQTSLLQKNTNKQKTVSILTTPVTTATTSSQPPPVIPESVVTSTSVFLQHEQAVASLPNLISEQLLQMDESAGENKRTSVPSVHESGCSNPDPEAHRLEEELLLLEEELRPPNSTSPDIDRLLQSEIVLSPSKLQQT